MWPFSLLRKLVKDPDVGQTRGDYIGCYLLGTELPGAPQASYHSLATSHEVLEQDARVYLQEFLQSHPEMAAAQRDALQALLDDLPARLQAHMAGDTRQPLAEYGGAQLFLRTGLRARKKENGRYLE